MCRKNTFNATNRFNAYWLVIRPVVLLLSALLAGCSLQHHTDRAERQWLSAKAAQSALHSVTLANASAFATTNTASSFFNASSASTYLNGQIQSPAITELSGMSPVLGEKNRYWAINDSGNRSQLFVLDARGRHLGETELPVFNRDWEDLASFVYNGENYLAVAETGDNLRRYPISSIFIFKQPDVNNLPKRLRLYHRIDFSYEDGPRNVESMSVSAAESKIYLIAKNRAEANVYTLPLALGQSSTQEVSIARRAGQLAQLQSSGSGAWWERWFAGRLLLTATALDISADDRLAVVANYRHVYLFRKNSGEQWHEAFARAPEIITTHRLAQSESVVFSVDATEVIVSSEGDRAPMLAIRPTQDAPVGKSSL